jgi:hypothetical protein
VLWSELAQVDWEETAPARDQRITEFLREGDTEQAVTKWLNDPQWNWVRDALDRDPKARVEAGTRVFRRVLLKRRDSLVDTEFPLVMRLMSCLAQRFGEQGTRLVVWFG